MGLRAGVAPAFVGALALAANAQAQGIKIHMHAKDGGYAADGMLFPPRDAPSSPVPALLLIPDRSGLVESVTDAARQFADAGYLVVAVDLNRGQPPDAAQSADPARSDEEAMHDLESALAFLSGQSRVRRDRIGVLGWGMGARFALRLAGATALHAVALEHIPLPGDPSDPNRHHGSILARFGAGDPGVSRRSMQEFVGRLRAAGDSVDSSVDEAHDAAANHRLELAFFERTLK